MALPSPSADSATLVTGASSGLGIELARLFAAGGRNLVLVARRRDRIREVADELSAAHGVRVEFIACDLSDPTERASLPGQVGALGLTVDVLVSNAGVGSSGEFVDLPADRELAMVRLNSEAVVGLCADFVPEMVKAGRGAVLIVSSSVAFQPIPRAATYSASKAFSLTFAESLHAELKRSGLSVTVVCPGPIDTEFGAVAGIPDLANQIPKSTMVPAAEVARQAVRGLARNRRVVVPGLTIRFAAAIGRYVPHGLLLRLYRRLWPL